MLDSDAKAIAQINADAAAYLDLLRSLPDGGAQADALLALAQNNDASVGAFARRLPFESSPYAFAAWLGGLPHGV